MGSRERARRAHLQRFKKLLRVHYGSDADYHRRSSERWPGWLYVVRVTVKSISE